MDPVWRRQWDRGPEPTLDCGSFLDLFVSWSPELVCVCVWVSLCPLFMK